MNADCINLLLADDDMDDCMFFKEALTELPIKSCLRTVNDGEQLMQLLTANQDNLPDILFLDLNMPRKTGYECLSEIKLNNKLQQLPVIIYSTSLNQEVANLLYEKGASHYIRKPGDFSKLKKVILEALTTTYRTDSGTRSKETFIIEA